MASGQKTINASTLLTDAMNKLEVNTVGVASLAEWPGTKLEETTLKLLPQARSVVVFAMEYPVEFLDLISAERVTGTPSLNDLFSRNTDYLNGRLNKASQDIAKASRASGFKALPLPPAGLPQDTRFLEAIFSYKHAAQAAGMGYFGRNSLILTPDFGPRVRLTACLTEALLEPTKAGDTEYACQHCKACINNCPSGAISVATDEQPYTINKFACNIYRTAAGGCSDCMRVCPAGR